MSLKALVYAYILGGLTFVPLALLAAVFFAIYTSVPVADPDPAKGTRAKLEKESQEEEKEEEEVAAAATSKDFLSRQPKAIKEGVTLKEYQLLGLNWLRLMHQLRHSAILADEMGAFYVRFVC